LWERGETANKAKLLAKSKNEQKRLRLIQVFFNQDLPLTTLSLALPTNSRLQQQKQLQTTRAVSIIRYLSMVAQD